MILSQLVLPSSLCLHVCSLCLCLYFCPANRFICTIFLDSVYMILLNICFSLSALLHSIQQTLDPSTPLQMSQFHPFLWLNYSIVYYVGFHCVYVPHLFLNLFLNWRIIALQTCCFLSNINKNQYTYVPSLLALPPISASYPLGRYRAPVWVPWVIQQIPNGYLFYIW